MTWLNFIPDRQTFDAKELNQLLSSFNTCLETRDKYMRISLQRLGDNPKDYDGVFQGFGPEDIGGVNGVRSDAWESLRKSQGPEAAITLGKNKTVKSKSQIDEQSSKPWTIYPPPPPPHWHWRPKPGDSHEPGTSQSASGMPNNLDPYHRPGYEGFDFKTCEIPGKHHWSYEIDDKGVFQVYDRSATEQVQAGPASKWNSFAIS